MAFVLLTEQLVLIVNEQGQPLKQDALKKRRWSWLRLFIGVLLSVGGLWLVTRQVSWDAFLDAVTSADGFLILLALVIVIVTSALKAWRWRFIFYPPERMPSYKATFWATYLGQFINNTPLRVGELARAYTLSNETNVSTAQALGTIVVEKSLDLLMMVFTLALLLAYGLLPGFIDNPGLIALTAFVLMGLLYVITYRTDFAIRTAVWFAAIFPERIERFIVRLATSGLKGLAALRNPRLTVILLGASIIIAFLSVLVPYLLFLAFELPLGLAEAALLHLALTVSINVPSTPGRIGVFEATVYIVLAWLGLDNGPLILGYALVFHVVTLLPQLVFGGIAVARSNWNWRDANFVE
ncbi:MAG: flippase-like domain-containing protein [Anaerolineae bacterium]|nr:flippase-like domain-containing protein [Anaerolineae bacterium]MCO5196899.1 flippase-like domain-containing protein [Anaerolineae bacterium]